MINLDEIRRRKLWRWVITYIAGAWAVLQFADLVGDRFGWPDIWLRWLIVLISVGFPVILVIGWYHGERAAKRVNAIEAGLLSVLLVIAATALYFVGRSSDSQGGAAASLAPVATVGQPAASTDDISPASLAVLPFENMSSSAEQEYFSDGLTEELLNVLAQVPELRVAARTSAFAFKGKRETIDVIARTLKVAHVLEGSVRRAGDRIRISVQLIDARTGFRQWASTYDRNLVDVFAVQEEISRAIVNEMRVRVGGSLEVTSKTANPEAYALYLQGTQALRATGSPQEFLNTAERSFKLALQIDPQYPAALAGLAEALRTKSYFGLMDAKEGYGQASDYAKRAIQLNPDEPTAHGELGIIADWANRDYVAAEQHYRRALEINPSASRLRSYYAWLLSRLGRQDEALDQARRAVEIDPLSISARTNYGSILIFARKPEQAIEQYKSALALDANDVITMGNLSAAYAQTGSTKEAVEIAERALKIDPELAYGIAVAGYAYGLAGRTADAQRMLAKLESKKEPYLLANVSMGLNDRDAVFRYLEQSVEELDDNAGDLAMDPVFDPVRNDPRMAPLLAKLKLAKH